MGGEPGYEPADAFGLLRSYERHVRYVQLALDQVSHALVRRGLAHDMSKMADDEFSGFARINAAARINKFGSPEYSEAMDRERETIDRHFMRNSHHAEYPTYGNDAAVPYILTFLDIIEMVCDWRGAQQGYGDTRPWRETVKLNIAAKGKYLSPEQLWLVQQVVDFLDPEAHDGR